MSLWKTLQPSAKLETEGVDITIPNPEGRDWRFTILAASQGNKRYIAALEREHRKVQKQMQMGTLTPEENRAILIRVFAETIIKAWEVTHPDDPDRDFPLNFQNAVELLTKLPPIFTILKGEAENGSNFSIATAEAAAGNLESASDTT